MMLCKRVALQVHWTNAILTKKKKKKKKKKEKKEEETYKGGCLEVEGISVAA
jgi:hypothetical protein